ncbi:MAG: phosphoribose diphosphate:decaprenyl-phosphate phosphoribosyltransferase [Candidatus Woesebacteria bacterium GW2011_GWF1_31_35]|uniref:4-hydroxybenzoate octaprenyltransferase n=1 Tax=Candidatus Woesebacteria bacterium GW2011_GWC2_31_9 TaxID=1618586 RepID=A0A0F9YL45_9BACT|nr:MAG: phosphoribose diphosphate:decaprenyl-phosphate phosphoribosyltransferase [Candidatus Woesebacteria bacterium GW2011_GWF1_31_35]KKP23245.1 MAG: 4-hydroxybenzoate octaprenyltransferase [Candidatus Woesebacteria bacterium GW2011_GWC1_30_29]KKP25503.1 MAG: 4-hydroxybenzoate octaprenyltransferase [Candidatus Woesebacteria bacterium GW2011_GWD1_31_12]KKP27507.1 MAG: 4-hydroxybenzoate octaprenyltransferase [Candidatus Woesebacteria bacterium GW2011_GWB1_31_29]KKP30945.1 MAG: 4-hydroxybenzoate 
MVNISLQIIRIARPVHWIKNFALFAALFLTGTLFEKGLFLNVIYAFIAFSLATSATYIFNDIMDAKKDKLHPIKRLRPIASGKLPIPIAILEFIFLVFLSLTIASSLNHLLFVLIVSYLIIQTLYSLGLKNIHVIDILIIATGFIMRVYAGAFVINAHLSVWFLLCVVSASLFLAAGKRRAEINLLEAVDGGTRKSLSKYSKELLNSYVTMFGNATWMSWSLYTFFESPKASLNFWLVLAELSRATTISKLMMLTIPVVIFGIMRYEALIFEGKSEAPEKLLLTDKGLLIGVTLWIVLIYWIIYSGVSVAGI